MFFLSSLILHFLLVSLTTNSYLSQSCYRANEEYFRLKLTRNLPYLSEFYNHQIYLNQPYTFQFKSQSALTTSTGHIALTRRDVCSTGVMSKCLFPLLPRLLIQGCCQLLQQLFVGQFNVIEFILHWIGSSQHEATQGYEDDQLHLETAQVKSRD